MEKKSWLNLLSSSLLSSSLLPSSNVNIFSFFKPAMIVSNTVNNNKYLWVFECYSSKTSYFN